MLLAQTLEVRAMPLIVLPVSAVHNGDCCLFQRRFVVEMGYGAFSLSVSQLSC